jgi:hypothetical protein
MDDAVPPSWVMPEARQLADCFRLAADDSRRLRAGGLADGNYEAGVASTVAWVLAVGPPPVTGQPAEPRRAAAEAEMAAAGEVELGRSPRGATVPADAAQGARRTLAWLLGLDPHPPVPLPRRPLPSAEQLYEEVIAAEPHRRWLPEDHTAARLAASREADRLARLATRADSLAPRRPRSTQ